MAIFSLYFHNQGVFMADNGRLQADPLFQGLARPTMILGVSFLFFVLNGAVSMISFINSQNFLVLFLVAPVIHMIGYLLCMHEPRAVELVALRGSRGYLSWNNILGYHHNTNSYDVL